MSSRRHRRVACVVVTALLSGAASCTPAAAPPPAPSPTRSDVTRVDTAVSMTVISRVTPDSVQSRETETPRRAVSTTYHGVRVDEDYRWLEAGADPLVQQWSDAQTARARAALDSLPSRAPIARWLTSMFGSAAATMGSLTPRGGMFFATRLRSGAQQAEMVAFRSVDDLSGARVIVDPNRIDPTGHASFDWFVPSHDARYLAVSLSRNGSEDGTIHVFDVATGRELPDTIARAQYPTGGGSVAWDRDNSGFYYTRYPDPGERPDADLHFYQRVFHHRLGTPASSDRYVIGREFPRIAEVQLATSENGPWVLATVGNGDGGEFAHYVMDGAGRWTQVTRFADRATTAVLGPDSALYLVSLAGAPHGRVLRLPLAPPRLSSARVVVESSPSVIEAIAPTRTRLYVAGLAGGPSDLRVFDHGGRALAPVVIEPVTSVEELERTSGDEIVFRSKSYLRSSVWFKYSPRLTAPVRTAVFNVSPVSFSDVEVVREVATSKDGTQVPIYVRRRKGIVLNGHNPVLLTGYGGYNISMRPGFSPADRLWLDQGGVIATAILRGGGEFGAEWHEAGRGVHKQNVFDDFIAAAEQLITARYTTPERLAIEGGSNGGLLMGAVLTQRPDLFRAVFASVGVYDMLRAELDPNGAFNIPEFGSVTDTAQFRALYAYSPYHHVRDGVAYPAVLMMTGANDGPVNPANSRKMVARLQAATSSARPVYLISSSTSGHGFGSSANEAVEQQADVFAFLLSQLGVPYHAPAPPTP